jgi:transcriptional regulator with XRE-family HTH domain
MAKRASRPFVEELPSLLEERGMSLRAVARAAGVGDDHLSRVLRGARSKKASPELTKRVAAALGLPDDYFVEARLDFVSQRLSRDPALLDRVYDRLRRS